LALFAVNARELLRHFKQLQRRFGGVPNQIVVLMLETCDAVRCCGVGLLGTNNHHPAVRVMQGEPKPGNWGQGATGPYDDGC
jgi:hypothetical protein